MRVHLATHFFAPRPPGVFAAELARHWARSGLEVVVITAQRGVPLDAGFEVEEGLPFEYVTSSLARRLASRMAFSSAAAVASLRHARAHGRPDVVVSIGVSPWLGVGRTFGRARGPRLITWLLDLWPDVLLAHRPESRVVSASVALLRAPISALLERSDDVVAISPRMSDRVRASVTSPRVHTIPLWAPADALSALSAAPPEHAPEAGSKLVALYHGNLGLAYDFGPILAAAKRFHRDDVSFVFVGDGPQHAYITREIASAGLHNVALRAPVRGAELGPSLALGDVHLLPLRASFDAVSFPSKMLASLAAGRPTVVLGPEDGEAAQLVRRSGSGIAVPATADGLEGALRSLLADPAARHKMGAAARALHDQRFAAERAFAAWDDLLRAAPAGSDRP